MAGNVYLISVASWENYGFINSNIDENKMKPIILRAQTGKLRPVLGKALYDKILDDVENDTLSGLYEELLNDYIQNFLYACCDYMYTFHSTSQMTNKTTGRNNDQYINSNTVDQNNNLRDELRKHENTYENIMKCWLKENYNDIPELKTMSHEYCDCEEGSNLGRNSFYHGNFEIV